MSLPAFVERREWNGSDGSNIIRCAGPSGAAEWRAFRANGVLLVVVPTARLAADALGWVEEPGDQLQTQASVGRTPPPRIAPLPPPLPPEPVTPAAPKRRVRKQRDVVLSRATQLLRRLRAERLTAARQALEHGLGTTAAARLVQTRCGCPYHVAKRIVLEVRREGRTA